jgi:hypothetical protein
MPGIKVRKNSIVSLKNNSLRNREAKFQTRDFVKWKKRKESMEAGGLLNKLFSLPSKECLKNTHQQPGFKTG